MTQEYPVDTLEIQKKKVFSENPSLELVAPCKVGEGILRLTENEENYYFNRFLESNCPLLLFIPASGSGSRMFQFLYEFLDKPTNENRSQVELFLNSLNELAFFKQIPIEIQQSALNQTMDLEKLIAYILNKEGLGFGYLPKGLIPFHRSNPFILNPFQEQILQGTQLGKTPTTFHFTIQSVFEEKVRTGIKHVEGLTGIRYDVTFSEQSAATNSIAFLENGEVAKSETNEFISRPAGHGALLDNLNQNGHALIFIKNIDNLQHINKSSQSKITWSILGGILLAFKDEALELYRNPTKEGLKLLNNKYQLYATSELDTCQTSEDIKRLIDRPTRVCGMVKNEGQPGGGPFWVNEKGVISKQIVEKAQISTTGDQYKLIVQSTHFNPVMIAASTISLSGEKFDLTKYRDESKYFIVHKTQQGQTIRYLELPGLWNGGMANWNTLFVEVPSATFSPVKTVLDLLGEMHKA